MITLKNVRELMFEMATDNGKLSEYRLQGNHNAIIALKAMYDVLEKSFSEQDDSVKFTPGDVVVISRPPFEPDCSTDEWDSHWGKIGDQAVVCFVTGVCIEIQLKDGFQIEIDESCLELL